MGVGRPEELGKLRKALEDKYKIKVETLSGDAGDVQEVKILNKIVRWTDTGVELEADPRHAEIVIRELGLTSAALSKVPGVKPPKIDEWRSWGVRSRDDIAPLRLGSTILLQIGSTLATRPRRPLGIWRDHWKATLTS